MSVVERVRGPAPLAHPWIYRGTVESFDADSGLGVVASGEGETWQFHSTAIADGSREISVGADVSFLVAAGGPGVWEAHNLRSSDS